MSDAAGPTAPEGATAPPPGRCANCGAEVAERYCSRCGQDRGRTPHVPLSELLGEAIGEALSVDSRMGRTLGPFLFRPGFLTQAYLAGRRVRYSSPLRLYLLATVAFFLAVSTREVVVVRLGADQAPGLHLGAASGPASPQGETADAPQDIEKALAGLRQGGRPARLLADRLETLSRLPPAEASRRMGQSLLQQAPRVFFFLVPVMAGLLLLLHRRSGLFYAEHLVFALHAHAIGFATLLPGALLDSPALALGGMAAAALHLLLALRRVYRCPWPGTVLRFAALGLAYLVALGVGLAVASLLALAFL